MVKIACIYFLLLLGHSVYFENNISVSNLSAVSRHFRTPTIYGVYEALWKSIVETRYARILQRFIRDILRNETRVTNQVACVSKIKCKLRFPISPKSL